MKKAISSIFTLFIAFALHSQTLTIKSGKNSVKATISDGITVETSFFESDSMILTLNDGNTGKDSVITYTLITPLKGKAIAHFITAKEDVIIPNIKKINLKRSKMIIKIRRKHTPDKLFIVDVK